MHGDWEWDETLYRGSATHYSLGRMPYPAGVADVIGSELGLDGTGRLLDVGCGPGALTLLLAPMFESAVGIDADRAMIAEAVRRAAGSTIADVEWRQLRAEDLPPDLGPFRVATFAQSFHWMDQLVVAHRVRRMLVDGGAWVHVHATTHRGVPGDDPLPHPRPPWNGIEDLVAGYLGPTRRAGQGVLPTGTRAGEEDVMRQAGFTGPRRLQVDGGQVVDRQADDIVSAVFSLSSSAPHLFAERLAAFETDLRRLLQDSSPTGRFSERTAEVAIVIWRP